MAEPNDIKKGKKPLNMEVLLIDDDSFTRQVYESELHQQNIGVSTAADGMEGLRLAKERRPAIILMELIQTKLNGFELIKEIRKDPAFSEALIVIASVLNQKQDMDEAIALGANKYLSKNDYSAKQIITEVVNLIETLL